MYITNCDRNKIIRWISGESVGISDQRELTSSLLNCPLDVRVDQYQNIYVTDSRNYRIQIFCLNGENREHGLGNSTVQLAQQRSLQFDFQMNLFVSDTTNHGIIKGRGCIRLEIGPFKKIAVVPPVT